MRIRLASGAVVEDVPAEMVYRLVTGMVMRIKEPIEPVVQKPKQMVHKKSKIPIKRGEYMLDVALPNICLGCGKAVEKPQKWCSTCAVRFTEPQPKLHGTEFNWSKLTTGTVIGYDDIRPALNILVETTMPIEATMIDGVGNDVMVWSSIAAKIIEHSREILDHYDFGPDVKLVFADNKIRIEGNSKNKMNTTVSGA